MPVPLPRTYFFLSLLGMSPRSFQIKLCVLNPTTSCGISYTTSYKISGGRHLLICNMENTVYPVPRVAGRTP